MRSHYRCEGCGASLNDALVFRTRAGGELRHGVGYHPSGIAPFARHCGPVEPDERASAPGPDQSMTGPSLASLAGDRTALRS